MTGFIQTTANDKPRPRSEASNIALDMLFLDNEENDVPFDLENELVKTTGQPNEVATIFDYTQENLISLFGDGRRRSKEEQNSLITLFQD